MVFSKEGRLAGTAREHARDAGLTFVGDQPTTLD